MTLRLHVAGSSGAVPRPNRACSCYLLRSETIAVALDLGSGATARLGAVIACGDLDAVVISHLHADHVLDLVPLRYTLMYGETKRAAPLPVFVPPNSEATLAGLAAAFRSTREAFFGSVMDVRSYDPAVALEIGDLRITFARTVHFIEAYAMRVTDGQSIVSYSADTAPCDAVVGIAAESDLFLCEATLGVNGADADPRGHCTAREAAEMAARARTKHLVLTHYGAQCDPLAMLSAAHGAYSGAVSIADDGVELGTEGGSLVL